MSDTDQPQPGFDPPDMTMIGQLSAHLTAVQQALAHQERLVAAILTKVGPVAILASEYAAARPDEVRNWSIQATPGGDTDAAVVFGLPGHANSDGRPTTRDEVVIATLLRNRDQALPQQASAVLTAIGLPARSEA